MSFETRRAYSLGEIPVFSLKNAEKLYTSWNPHKDAVSPIVWPLLSNSFPYRMRSSCWYRLGDMLYTSLKRCRRDLSDKPQSAHNTEVRKSGLEELSVRKRTAGWIRAFFLSGIPLLLLRRKISANNWYNSPVDSKESYSSFCFFRQSKWIFAN